MARKLSYYRTNKEHTPEGRRSVRTAADANKNSHKHTGRHHSTAPTARAPQPSQTLRTLIWNVNIRRQKHLICTGTAGNNSDDEVETVPCSVSEDSSVTCYLVCCNFNILFSNICCFLTHDCMYAACALCRGPICSPRPKHATQPMLYTYSKRIKT